MNEINGIIDNLEGRRKSVQDELKQLEVSLAVARTNKNSSVVKILKDEQVKLRAEKEDLVKSIQNLNKIKNLSYSGVRKNKTGIKTIPNIKKDRQNIVGMVEDTFQSTSGTSRSLAKEFTNLQNFIRDTVELSKDDLYLAGAEKSFSSKRESLTKDIYKIKNAFIKEKGFRRAGYSSQENYQFLSDSKLKRDISGAIIPGNEQQTEMNLQLIKESIVKEYKDFRNQIATEKVLRKEQLDKQRKDLEFDKEFNKLLNQEKKDNEKAAKDNQKSLDKETKERISLESNVNKIISQIFTKNKSILENTDFKTLGFNTFKEFRDYQTSLLGMDVSKAKGLNLKDQAPELQKILMNLDSTIQDMRADKIDNKLLNQEKKDNEKAATQKQKEADRQSRELEREINRIQSENERFIASSERNKLKTGRYRSQDEAINDIMGLRTGQRADIIKIIEDTKKSFGDPKDTLAELTKIRLALKTQTEMEELRYKTMDKRRKENFLERMFSKGYENVFGVNPKTGDRSTGANGSMGGGVGGNVAASLLGGWLAGPMGAILAPIVWDLFGGAIMAAFGGFIAKKIGGVPKFLGSFFSKSGTTAAATTGISNLKGAASGVVGEGALKMLGKSLPFIGAATNFGLGVASGESVGKAGSGALGGLGGGLAGAAAGAMFGPIGSVIGGVIGGIVGEKAIDGLYDYFMSDKPEKKLDIRKPKSVYEEKQKELKDVVGTHTLNRVSTTMMSQNNQNTQSSSVVNNNNTTVINGVDPNYGYSLREYNSGFN